MMKAALLLLAVVAMCSAQTPNVDYVAYDFRRDNLLTTHNTQTRKQNRYEGWEFGYSASGTFTPMVYDGTSKYAFGGVSVDLTSMVPTPTLPVIVKYRFRQNWNTLKNVVSITRTGNTPAKWASWTNSGSATITPTVAPAVTVTQSDLVTGDAFASGDFTTDGAYLNGHISSSPAVPNHFIRYSNIGTRTITLSPTVVRPVMAIVSLGTSTVEATMTFNHDFTIVSEGVGNYGSGTYIKAGLTLKGKEWHGLIQFQATVGTLTINYGVTESYSGFNIGMEDSAVADTVTLDVNGGAPVWTTLISKGETRAFSGDVTGAPAVLEGEFFDLKATTPASHTAGDKLNLEWKIVAPCNEPCTCFFCTDEFDDFCPTVEPTPVPTPAEHHEEICVEAYYECVAIEDACFDIDDDCFDNVEPNVMICDLADFCFELADVCFAFVMHCDLEVEACPQ